MPTPDESSAQQRPGENANAATARGSNLRLLLLVGLLALALFALWYDYKVARPAVELAYERIAAKNEAINTAAVYRRMTSVDVRDVLGRDPSETFLSGRYTVEVYRWNAGMPIEFRGLSGGESPGIGLKTHDYYAVYRKDGPDLGFITHFKFDLNPDELEDKRFAAVADETAADETAANVPDLPGMGANTAGPGGPGTGFATLGGDGPGGPGGEGPSREGPSGEGAGRRQRPPLETSEVAPADEAAACDAAPASESQEDPADS